MKKETRELTIDHPEFGKLKKKVTYTFDDSKYATLDEAITDHELMEKEKNELSEKIQKENKLITETAKQKHSNDVLAWEKKLEDLRLDYQKKIDDLKKEYESTSQDLYSKKPVYAMPELKKIDVSIYSGRGYVNKEAFTEDAKPNLIEIMANATEQEKEAIRAVLNS